jgi:hypothetical protein
MPSAIAQKMPKPALLTSSRTDPRFVDVKPMRGTVSVRESERIMRMHGLHPMTSAERKIFAAFLRD